MQKINIIAVGRLKESFFKAAEQEYLKRLSGYCNIGITEIQQQVLPKNPSKSDIENALDTEGKNIISKIPKGSCIVTLCIEGKKVSSTKLAEIIESNKNTSGNMTFIIGGSYGLCEEVKKLSNIRLSMSDMTFPHRLARIMLLEQIYRSYKISEGSGYHK